MGQCNGCPKKEAGHFDVSQSTTAQPLSCQSYGCSAGGGTCDANGQCAWSLSYETCVDNHPLETCTLAGNVLVDEFAIGGLSAETALGTVDYQTRNFFLLGTVSGLMGLSDDSTYGRPNPLFALAKTGEIEPIFSFCFGADRHHGRFSLGGVYEPAIRKGTQLQYMNMIPNDMYVLPMTNVRAGNLKGVSTSGAPF